MRRGQTTMINLLIGPPGGGKSYEATVFHVLPALSKGRKVITNLPLDLGRIAQIDATYPDLIEIRTATKAVEKPAQGENRAAMIFGRTREPEFCNRAFANPEDYGDEWRHPETGSGPLYVVDECHLAMPRGGTARAVEEWYSLHRHESADVMLITQSYGKVSKSIIDLVQVCYRVKKGTAFGTANNYIRKVQDGVRGDVVNTTVRKYEKKYFGLYKSHTRGGGEELAANDIVPIWKRWPFVGAAVVLPLSAVIYFSGGSPNILKPKPPASAPQAQNRVVDTPAKIDAEKLPVGAQAQPEGHPFTGRTLHIAGVMKSINEQLYLFVVAQNGQAVSEVTSRDLIKLGYKVEAVTPCGVKLSLDKWSNWIICDAPQIGIVPSEGATSNSRKA